MGVCAVKELEKYKAEAEERWGATAAYKEHAEKTKNYSEDKWSKLAAGMAEFASRAIAAYCAK